MAKKSMKEIKEELYRIATKGTPKELDKLLSEGIDVNLQMPSVKDKWGMKSPVKQTALHIAVVRGRKPMIEKLLKANADVNIQDNDGCTPLFYARKEPSISLLIKNGADIHMRDNSGQTVLHKMKDASSTQILLENNADINAQDNDGKTLLHRIVGLGDQKQIELLLEKGADVNITDNNGFSALHFAVSAPCYNLNSTKLLMKHGADPSIKTTKKLHRYPEGLTPVDMALLDSEHDSYHKQQFSACINVIKKHEKSN